MKIPYATGYLISFLVITTIDRGLNIQCVEGSIFHGYGVKISWVGVKNIARGVYIPWVGGQYTMDRGKNTMGRRVKIPSVGGSICHG